MKVTLLEAISVMLGILLGTFIVFALAWVILK